MVDHYTSPKSPCIPLIFLIFTSFFTKTSGNFQKLIDKLGSVDQNLISCLNSSGFASRPLQEGKERWNSLVLNDKKSLGSSCKTISAEEFQYEQSLLLMDVHFGLGNQATLTSDLITGFLIQNR
jgi:hypothetical protein